MKVENLERLLNPKSIVFIGTHDIIHQGIQNAQALGFSGKIYAVHQTRKEIRGIHCFKNISELPFSIDAAYIAVRASSTVGIIQELKEIGVSGAVCYASGFSEIGETELQNKLIEVAGDMAVVGPNCYGLINFLDAVPLWPDRHGGEVIDEGVALISQSGNLSLNLTMTDRALPLAYAISIGNQAVLEMADYIKALVKDPRVKAIGLHIEGINDMEKFIKAAHYALEKRVPIVALKTGTSELGSKLTESHTSSLAGSDELYDSLFKRLNICRVDSLSSLLETLKLFSITGKVYGRKIGVLTCSGGESTIIADYADQYHISLPELAEAQEKEISSMLTQFEHVGNPLDYNTSIWGKEDKLEKCFTEFMKGPFDAIILVLDLLNVNKGNVQPWIASIKAYIKSRKSVDIPTILISVLPEGLPNPYRDKLLNNNITPLQGVTEAFKALDTVMTYTERIKTHIAIEEIPLNLLLPSSPLETDQTVSLNEWEGKQKIHRYGVRIPQGKLIEHYKLDDELTDELTAPFVVKKVSRDIVHKTDVGAVHLSLTSEDEVKQAIEDMSKNLVHMSKLEELYLVEEMVKDYVAELNIGIIRDDQFGLALIISMGGELVNLLHDSAAVLLPTTREEMEDALKSLKGYPLLKGFRGRPLGDIEAVLNTAEAVAKLAEDYSDHILEMDINPLLVMPEGKGAIAVDAYIHMNSDIEHERVL